MKAKQLAEETGNTGRMEITEREEREAESNVKKLQDVSSIIKFFLRFQVLASHYLFGLFLFVCLFIFLQALNNVISVIKSADEDKLHSVDASQLMGLLDRLMKGDDLTSLPVYYQPME